MKNLIRNPLRLALILTFCLQTSACSTPSEKGTEPLADPTADKAEDIPVIVVSPPSAASTETSDVWIAKPDGAIQCKPKSGKALEEGAESLLKAGIKILESKKGEDGKMRAQLCGIAAGTLNLYRIEVKDLATALKLGFHATNP